MNDDDETKTPPKRSKGRPGAPAGHPGPLSDAERMEQAMARPDGWLDEARRTAITVLFKIQRDAAAGAIVPSDGATFERVGNTITSHESLMARRGGQKPQLASVTPIRSALAGAVKP